MEPGMCVKGCGFFGTAKNRNMCSRCFTDSLESEMAVDSAAIHKRRDGIPPPRKIDDLSSITATMKKLTVRCSEKKRCDECKKKAGVTGFECRCGGLFCEKHRLPEQHKCSFNFKTQNQNVSHMHLTKADKLKQRI